MFSQAMGARPGVPRIAVVVTDGRSSSMADTVSLFHLYNVFRPQNVLLIKGCVCVCVCVLGRGVCVLELAWNTKI